MIYIILAVLVGVGLFFAWVGRKAWQEGNGPIKSSGARGTAIGLFLLAMIVFSAAGGIAVMALSYLVQ